MVKTSLFTLNISYSMLKITHFYQSSSISILIASPFIVLHNLDIISLLFFFIIYEQRVIILIFIVSNVMMLNNHDLIFQNQD